jgi:exodeoxyribonuclease V gamma subunit
VPIAELLDAVSATAVAADGTDARSQVVTSHPLQGHDANCFTPGQLGLPGPWSYDRVQLSGSVAARTQHEPSPWLAAPLPALDESVIQLEALVSFVEHPVRAFLRRRLGLWLRSEPEPPPDALQTELDPLERWGVGQRLLDAALAGTPLARAAAAEAARGYLPPDPLRDAPLDEAASEVAQLLTVLGAAAGPADSLDVHIELPDGRSVVGTVPRVRGDRMVVCTYSRLAPKHRLATWVRHLALCAGRPELDSASVLVGRGASKSAPPARIDLPPIPGGADERRAIATELMAEVVDLYDRGMRAPLPLACKTSAAFAEATLRDLPDDTLWERVRECWEDGWWFDERRLNEQSDRDHIEVWGRAAPLRVLLADRPAPDEDAWGTGATTRFAALALRLWTPVLRAERGGR